MQEWRLSIHQGVVLVQFDSGTIVSLPILKNIIKQLNADPDKYRTTNIVWDMRNIQFPPDMDFEKIFGLVRHIENSWKDSWQIKKSAIVTQSKAVFGISRIYASLVNGQLNYEVNLFEDDLQQAIEWAKPF